MWSLVVVGAGGWRLVVGVVANWQLGGEQQQAWPGLAVEVEEGEGEEEEENGIWPLLDVCLIYLVTWLILYGHKVAFSN